jgi:hypothetical protein
MRVPPANLPCNPQTLAGMTNGFDRPMSFAEIHSAGAPSASDPVASHTPESHKGGRQPIKIFDQIPTDARCEDSDRCPM